MKKNTPKLGIIILAAGKGTRMNSDKPKVLHQVGGKPMLAHVIETAKALSPDKIVVVVGYESQQVRNIFSEEKSIAWAIQDPMLGTGHAIQFAKQNFADFAGNILVLYGDVPAISKGTLQNLVDAHIEGKTTVKILTVELQNPKGYGRVIKDEQDQILEIVEENDASDEQKRTKLANTGIGIYDASFLMQSVFELESNNQQNEYYLTDVISLAVKKGHRVGSLVVDNQIEIIGINTPEGLKKLEAKMEKR